jgi:hypothetical protein
LATSSVAAIGALIVGDPESAKRYQCLERGDEHYLVGGRTKSDG